MLLLSSLQFYYFNDIGYNNNNNNGNNNNWGNNITYPVHNMKSMLSPIFAFINCSTEEISSYEESQL